MDAIATERTPKSANPEWTRAQDLLANWQTRRADLKPIEDALFGFLDAQLRRHLAVKFGWLADDRRDDLAGSIWPKMLTRLRKFDASKSSLRTYFYSSAYFDGLDVGREELGRYSHKRDGLLRTFVASQGTGDGGEPTDVDSYAADDCDAESERRAFCELIEPCKGQTRAMLDLFYLRRWSLREIGDLFGVGECRACQLMADAMNFLESYWGRRLHELHDIDPTREPGQKRSRLSH